jgi:uncharacterized protein YwqG
MKFLAELEMLLKSKDSPAFAAKVLAHAKPGIFLKKQCEVLSTERSPIFGLFNRKPKLTRRGLAVAPGASRLGGLPELPQGFPWPVREGKPMQFLAQINCAQIQQYREHTLLPDEGTLHFFLEEDGSESLVTLTSNAVPLLPVQAPAGASSPNFIIPQFPVEFALIPTFPHSETKEFEAMISDDAEAEIFFSTHDAWARKYLETQYGDNGARHQIGGYPEAIQGDVWTECEMISNNHIASTNKTLWEQAAANARRWRLLLQFDTDDDMNVMWGDAGTIYFCIREDDLRAGKFDKVCSTMQCG